MNDIELTYRELYLYVMIGGAILGALLGLVPFVLGRRKNKGRLGLYGFLASIVGGALAPLLAIIIAAAFSWIIVRDKPVQTDGAPKNGTSDPASD